MNFLELVWLALAIVAGLAALVYAIDLLTAAFRTGMTGANIILRLIFVGVAAPACIFFLNMTHLVSIG